MTDTAPTPADDVWAQARDAYLTGATGAYVCRRFQLAPSTFWRRAGQEGWLRRDAPADLPEPEPFDPEAPVEPPTVARDKAWQRLCRALDQGRAAEAQTWLRLHEVLGEVVRRQEVAARRAADQAPEAVQQRLDAFYARIDEQMASLNGG